MHGSCEKVGVAVHEDFKNVKLQPLFGLGIDAGGTFTDAVVVNINGAQILAWAKAPTTPENPLYGLRKALREIPTQALQKAGFVSLATTFATNAIVEEKGGRAGLVLIGYDRDHPGLSKMSPVLFLGGGHDFWGEEVAALKLAPLEERLPSLVREVDAIAVSGYFSIRNPDHELRVARFIADRCDLPVVLGHQLSTRLDAPRRAATAWWNARLMPLIHLLIEDTRKILKEFGIDVPLLVVRGDGTLMSAKEAQERPVETILSGPAASILGARYLTGRRDGLVVDMGGTTSDMAILKNGRVQIDGRGPGRTVEDPGGGGAHAHNGFGRRQHRRNPGRHPERPLCGSPESGAAVPHGPALSGNPGRFEKAGASENQDSAVAVQSLHFLSRQRRNLFWLRGRACGFRPRAGQ